MMTFKMIEPPPLPPPEKRVHIEMSVREAEILRMVCGRTTGLDIIRMNANAVTPVENLSSGEGFGVMGDMYKNLLNLIGIVR